MNPTLAVVFAVLSGLATLYAMYDLWRRWHGSSSVEVTRAAVALLAPYQEEVARLRQDLAAAGVTIVDLKQKLAQADIRVSGLNTDLENARTELAYLRVQVRTLTTQLSKGTDPK